MDKPFANYPQQAGVDEAKTGMGSTSEPAPGDMAPAGTPGTGEAICPQCRGTGRIDQRKCENCNGTGKVLQGIGGA
jgi:DnaJ-class molecular chaperone